MLNTNHDVDELIRTNTEVEVPDEVQERLRGRLVEFRRRVEQRPPSRLRMLLNSLVRPGSYRVPAMAAAVLVVVVAGLVLIPQSSNSGRVYAAAVAEMKAAQSLHYTVVLAPFTELDFSYVAPAQRRINCSWGIEIRSDGSGKELVLMHATKNYVVANKPAEDLAGTDFVEQWKSLPQTAEKFLGEQSKGSKRLLGYRVRLASPANDVHQANALDLWVDATTGNPDHAEVEIQEPGKPLYRMLVKDIRVNAEIDPSLFAMNAPAGYTPLIASGSENHSNPANQWLDKLRPEIKQSEAMTAVVLPMKGPYLQTRTAVQAVESYLRKVGVTPDGSAFGRFESEQHWDAGYPVPAGTRAEAPFATITMPATLVASAEVKGSWGQHSQERWAAFFKNVIEQGYVPAGPATEIWSGDEGRADSQSTEMRMAVRKAD
jgi:outer membrane lipoprotein-sorting protein